VTADNIEENCLDKQGFCMFVFLSGITEIDYEKQNHQNMI